MIRFLLIDLDNTILDFDKAEAVALQKTLEMAGIRVTPEIIAQYSQINKNHWLRLERKELTRDQVKVGRFQVLFDELGIAADALLISMTYEKLLSVGHYFLPGALEAIQRLSRRYRLFLASNGTASVQHSRLKSAELYPYFEKIFISQELGADKPAPEFFSRGIGQVEGFDPSQALMVGDSLSSDILGGIQAGIPTCWVNPQGKAAPADIRPTYEISSITELEALLEQLNA